jgi:RNA polymerase sigma-32 factor
MQVSATRNSLSVYLSDVGRYPMVTPAEEKRLMLEFRNTGDQRIAQKLVASNLRFVISVATKYGRYGLPLADLIQEGNMGLMRAVEKFEPSRGVRLISYAVWWIKAYIQSYVLRSWSLVKVGTTQVQRRLFFSLGRAKREIERLGGPAGLDDNLEELARHLGVKPEEITAMEQRLSARDFSLDTPSRDDGRPLLNLVPAAERPIDERLAEGQVSKLLADRIAESIAGLNSRERYIVERRIVAEKQMTFQALGEHFGVSRERARQLEQRAKEKLQESLERALFHPTHGSFPGGTISDLLN